MEPIYIIICSLALIAIAGFVLSIAGRRIYRHDLEKAEAMAASRQQELSAQLAEALSKAEAATIDKHNAELARTAAESESAAAAIRLSELKAAVRELEDRRTALENELSAKNAELKAANAKLTLNAEHEATAKTEREAFVKQQLELMKQQLENRSNELLKARAEELKSGNSTNMEAVVAPLKESLRKMEEALRENKSTHETSTATIKANIATLVETTLKVSSSADRLSNALTAETKIQGNWGEEKAERLLKALGLEEGLEYDTQAFLRDESGKSLQSDDTQKRMQPDIILHLDETRDLIIDSKVSLDAYTNYCNATDDTARKQFLDLHLKSLRNHVKGLASKSYDSYVKPPHQTVDFVMMFVPIEPALQTALAEDPSLWREAMEKGVFIVGEQNLYAAIRSVQETWKGIKQEKSLQEVYDIADRLVTRVGEFFERYQTLGDKLTDACAAFDSAGEKLCTGQQSLLVSARQLVERGAHENKKHRLPQAAPKVKGEKRRKALTQSEPAESESSAEDAEQ